MVIDFDDFGCNHVISDMCQAHDCRDKLYELKEINPAFKTTLFAIPGEMTPELINWHSQNTDWVELAWHGFLHQSNYECEKLSYHDMDILVRNLSIFVGDSFVKGFKAPGWQISDDIYKWLADNGWWVADQSYNDQRRPKNLLAYINNNGVFTVKGRVIPAWHGHTWDCVGNGIYETFDQVAELVRETEDFQFVSEALK